MKKIEGMGKTDYFMIAMIVVILFVTDYHNLQTIDYVLLVAIFFWVVMLGVRLYIVNVKNKR